MARALSVCFIYQYETIKQRVVSRVFQTFLRDFVFVDFGARLPAHRARPGRNDDAAHPPVARQSEKSAGLAKTQRTPSPLDFFAFPAPWRDTIFPARKDLHLLSESEFIVWKARSRFLQKIFCSASSRVARRADTRAQSANQTGSRGPSSSTRRAYVSPEAAPGASPRLIGCLILDNIFLLIYQ